MILMRVVSFGMHGSKVMIIECVKKFDNDGI